MLNFGQKLPIATLSKQKKIQNDPVGRLGAIKLFNFAKSAYLSKFVPIYFGNQT